MEGKEIPQLVYFKNSNNNKCNSKIDSHLLQFIKHCQIIQHLKTKFNQLLEAVSNN